MRPEEHPLWDFHRCNCENNGGEDCFYCETIQDLIDIEEQEKEDAVYLRGINE